MPRERLSWERVDLGDLEPQPPHDPREGALGVIYPRGRRHLLSGTPESAKSIVAAIIALEEIRAGGTVVWFDFEMGPYDTAERLGDLGYTADELERFVYLEPESPAGDAAIGDLDERYRPTLAVIDAAAGAYNLQGLDDYKRGDAEAFSRAWLQPFRARSVSTLVLDHVVKNTRNRGAWAVGSERKVGGVDVHLGFDAIVPLSRGKRGVVRVSTLKDRLGHLPRPRLCDVELRSDPETHAISWTLVAPAPETSGAFRPTVLMERVSRHLERLDMPVLRTHIYRDVKGRREWLVTAVECLLAEGFVEEEAFPSVPEGEGDQRSRPIRLVEPFREAFPDVPERSRNDRSTVPAPYKGADGNGNGPWNDDDEDEIERLAALAREAEE